MSAHEAALRVLVVDDEPVARASLRLALESLGDVDVVGDAASGDEAVEQLRTLAPEAVFLDVRMPGGDGFSVIERVGVDRMPPVVFVTAHDEFAVRAFEVYALDYVLKPFEDRRLAAAVARLRRERSRMADGRLADRLGALLENRAGEAAGGRYAVRIMVTQGDRIRFIPTADIDWLEAARNYVRVHVGPTVHLVRASLTGLLERLDPRQFVRIHRSTVVNADRIRELQPWFGHDYLAILQDGQRLKVSRTYRDNLLKPTS